MSEDLLKLGLLFGQEVDIDTQHLPEVLSFQHKLIQEYFAALYIAEEIKANEAFLNDKFPTLQEIHSNSDLLRFICGHLASTDASCITNHIAKAIADKIKDGWISNRAEIGKDWVDILEKGLDVLKSCHEEGSVSGINPCLCIYPSCGYPLSDVIKNTQFVIITDVKRCDPLKLETSSVPVVINMTKEQKEADEKEVGRLMEALSSRNSNLIAISIKNASDLHDSVCKLNSFSHLTFISLAYSKTLTVNNVRDLTQSINSHGSEPQLRSLSCTLPILQVREEALALYMPLIQALSKCINLKDLELWDGNPSECIPGLMGAPPPNLKMLHLFNAQPLDAVVHSIATAVRNHKLQQLEELIFLDCCIPTEEKMTDMIKAFVEVRPDQKIVIAADVLSPEIEAMCRDTQIKLIQNHMPYSMVYTGQQLMRTYGIAPGIADQSLCIPLLYTIFATQI